MKILAFLILGLIYSFNCLGQRTITYNRVRVKNYEQKKNGTKEEVSSFLIAKSKEDSLMREINDAIYSKIYNPKFFGKYTTPTFTILKVEYDDKGSVQDISFSDSADSLFLKLYSEMPNYHDSKATFKRYGAIKLYKDISILIPVYYEPPYDPYLSFPYPKIESIMKFKGKYFIGKSILLQPIRVPILKEHNM